MGRLEGKTAIVTGGASGIGLAIATGFAREGARVCIADISQAACDAAAISVGRGALGQALDVRYRDSINRAVGKAAAEYGGVDILVNCAGVFSMQACKDITEAEFDRVFSVNTRGLLFMTQAVANHMREHRRGEAIVNIASGVARRASPGATVYSASKAAVVGITQALAQELIVHGIRVNAIAPGSVRTRMWEEVETQFVRVMGAESGGAEKALSAQTPIGRMAMPEEFAGAAIYLASPESSYVVGQTLNVDGGMYLN
jgi:NAD(P)-dependent dehydrogenase (short-subunit alcohol dehydrogenase family)